eukprot:736668-Prorocentrum_minimum.AAC.5
MAYNGGRSNRRDTILQSSNASLSKTYCRCCCCYVDLRHVERPGAHVGTRGYTTAIDGSSR